MTACSGTAVARQAGSVLLLLATLLLGGCGTFDYYAQSVRGQVELLCRAEPIDRLLARADTSPDLSRRLRRVDEIRVFAVEQLALPDNGSYRDYVDVGRDALVWSVVATEEFSLTPREWCYPVIGCASYRGYFRRASAERYAERLRGGGLDVAIGRVPAYSTLGWFDDPVPSTVIAWPEHDLAGLLFHELAHQRLYLAGDTAFNEAYATVVEEQGIERWLRAEGDSGAEQRYRASQARQVEFLALLAGTRARLRELFEGDEPVALKRAAKAGIFADLQARYVELKSRWGGYAGYDTWFDRPLNNAHLASVATYRDRVPALQVLFDQVGGDFARFHAAAAALAALPQGERQQALRELGRRSGG